MLRFVVFLPFFSAFALASSYSLAGSLMSLVGTLLSLHAMVCIADRFGQTRDGYPFYHFLTPGLSVSVHVLIGEVGLLRQVTSICDLSSIVA